MSNIKCLTHLRYGMLAIGMLLAPALASQAEAGLGGNFYAIECTHISFNPYNVQSYDDVVYFNPNGEFLVKDSGATGVWNEADYGDFGFFTGSFDAGGSFFGFRFLDTIYMQSYPSRSHDYMQFCEGTQLKRSRN